MRTDIAEQEKVFSIHMSCSGQPSGIRTTMVTESLSWWLDDNFGGHQWEMNSNMVTIKAQKLGISMVKDGAKLEGFENMLSSTKELMVGLNEFF